MPSAASSRGSTATSGDGATGNPARRRQRRGRYQLTPRPDEKRFFLYSEEPIARITVLIRHLVNDDGEHHAKHHCDDAAEVPSLGKFEMVVNRKTSEALGLTVQLRPAGAASYG
jgi:hypothetical protein